MSGPVRIVIVGNGVAGAMAAAALASELPRSRFQLTIVPTGGELEGAVFAGDPAMRRFHAQLGLSDAALVQSAGASFTLGAAYAGWSRRRPAYFSPFGDIGATIDGVQFHQLIARFRRDGGEARLGDFSVATLLAQAGRFCHPSDDPASPMSTFSYGLHVDAAAYSSVLIDVARRKGAEVRMRGLARVELDQTGGIAALVLDDGEQLPADFVIDTSNNGKAIAAVDAAWESWSHLFPCDRMAHGSRTEATPPTPYSTVEALPAGSIRQVPCQGRAGETLSYSSDRLDQAGAEQLLAGRGAGSIHHSPFRPGRRKAPWSNNCVAVGAAASALEPLHPGPMLLILNSIERLLRLFPSGPAAEVEAREYNRETTDELNRARDLVLLRYLINDRHGEPMWDDARRAAAPPELARKIAAFRSRATVPMIDGDLFDEAEWALLFDEHGVRAARYDLLADAMPAERLGQLLERMQQLLTATAAVQPLHGEYLAKLRHKAAA